MLIFFSPIQHARFKKDLGMYWSIHLLVLLSSLHEATVLTDNNS